MNRYFAMLDTGLIILLEGATNFDEADEIAPGNTHWIFSEDGLVAFISLAQKALS